MRRVLPLLALLLSCARATPPEAVPPPQARPAAGAVRLPASPARAPGTLPPLFVEMVGHHVAVRSAAEAVIVGDVGAAAGILRDLGSRELHPDIPDHLSLYARALQAEARGAEEVQTLGEVATVLARSLVWCGKCHVAAGVPFRDAPPPLPEGDGLARRMERHAWIAGRMWDALVQGDPAIWSEAVTALREPPLDPGTLPHAPGREPAVAVLAQRLEDVSLEAAQAADVWEKADAVAVLYATCADCHLETGVAR